MLIIGTDSLAAFYSMYVLRPLPEDKSSPIFLNMSVPGLLPIEMCRLIVNLKQKATYVPNL